MENLKMIRTRQGRKFYIEDVKFKQYLMGRLGGVSAILKAFKGER